ncbi:hypothetical protein N1E91_11400 [Pseudomonas aeruginosa]|jgi:hypothetical protein|uniref:hypothetical protein n=1 Tax=Pseudomonas putida TaxID=303 RepID=UPI001C435A46|nr:hypothetical protein [Pseudomonas putida]MCS8129821.1 hypothetical protein [Pseudomonas aeruginosa]MCS9139055.1 hypothetical protein [Pseudomonas aeruginosa]MCS9211964.1 hypothetical protein [Pseudomonas aeruginosa]
MEDKVKLENHFTLAETLDKLRYVLSATRKVDALALLEKAVSKSRVDQSYTEMMEDALLRGSTVELRELLSAFGDYRAPPRSEFPFYPHSDAVNGIDSAMGAIKFDTLKPGALQEHIDFCNM